MSEDPRPPVAIRITRPFTTEDEFIEQELETLSRTSVTLLGAQPRPTGVVLRFELVLSSGHVVLRGEGRVVGFKPNAHQGLGGLTLRFTRLDSRSKALVDKAQALRERRRPSGSPPPQTSPSPPPAHAAHAAHPAHAAPPPLPPHAHAKGPSRPPPIPPTPSRPPPPIPSRPPIAPTPLRTPPPPAVASPAPVVVPPADVGIASITAAFGGPVIEIPPAPAAPSARARYGTTLPGVAPPAILDIPDIGPPPSSSTPLDLEATHAEAPASKRTERESHPPVEPPPAGRDALLGRLRKRADSLDAAAIQSILSQKKRRATEL